jgi:hypothetical protein
MEGWFASAAAGNSGAIVNIRDTLIAWYLLCGIY